MPTDQRDQPLLTIANDDPALLGSALAAFRARYAWNRHDLARWLGISLDALSALAAEPLVRHPLHEDRCRLLAERYAADLRRLETIIAHATGVTRAKR
jgi:hypothetical protein